MPSLDPDLRPSFYSSAARALQADFDSTSLADAHLASIVSPTISDAQRAFIESRDFFFLSTVDADGVDGSADVLEDFPGAQLVVRAHVDNVFVNCARYIHGHRRLGTSEYVPDEHGAQPYPSWKRIDRLQPFLPERDRGRAAEAGGELTAEEYARRLADGTS